MSRRNVLSTCGGPVRAGVFVTWTVCGCLVASGCGGPVKRPDRSTGTAAAPAALTATQGMQAQLLAGAVAILSALDRYDPQRASEQVFDRLVQWQHAATGGEAARVQAGGSIDGTAAAQTGHLLATLPERLRAPIANLLERPSFDAAGDVVAIRDRCWLAAVARTARGDATDELVVAEKLFRWTVRSLAPVSDPPMVPSEALPGSRWFLPGEILLAGRASGSQRAWIFLELLRQAGIDGVMLATSGAADTPSRPWLPAAVIDGEAYLFEPTYGMAVPGPGGKGVATARQAAADPTILAALSLPDRRYPVQAGDLAGGLTWLAVADPWSLAPRMAAIDRDLAAAHGVRVAAAVTEMADRVAAALPGDAAAVGLWTFPWETLARRSAAAGPLADELGPLELPVPDPSGRTDGFRPLFAGRVREFRGDFEGPSGAKAAYLAARPSRQAVTQAVAALPEDRAAPLRRALARMKEDATYWLGVVMLAEGESAAAADYLGRMTLEAAPDSRWTDAARINLATALIDLDRDAEAATLLLQDGSPQRFGSRLRAARLEAATTPEAATEKPEDPGSSGTGPE